jgi:uncharacterized protein YraI
MMKRTPARTSLIVAVIAAVFMVACGASTTPPTATLTAPAPNTEIQAGEEVTVQGKVTGSGIKQVDVFVNGAKFATVDQPARPNEFDVSVIWTAPTDLAGSSVIQLKGVNDRGESVVVSDAVFVTVISPTPVPPTATPEPTPIPTVAAPTAAPSPTAAPVLVGPKPENDFANVRALPDINAARLGQLNKGQSAPVRGKSADAKWFQITFPGAPGDVAWVLGEVVQVTGDANAVPVVQPSAGVTTTAGITPTTGITPVVAATAPAVTTTAPVTGSLQPPFVRLKAGQDFANVRTGPDTAYQKVGELTVAGTSSAAVRGRNADSTWWQIALPSAPGGLAWVFAQLVDLTGDPATILVAQAPPLPTPAATPTTAPPAAAAPATATAIPVGATATAVPSALLPYSQNVRFAPRDDIGDVPLGYQGQPKATTLQWQINGATRAEMEIVAVTPPDLYDCPAGNLASISPNDPAGKRIPLQLPSGEFNFSINDKGYYLLKIYVVKADGSTTDIPRAIIVDCFKKS